VHVYLADVSGAEIAIGLGRKTVGRAGVIAGLCRQSGRRVNGGNGEGKIREL
jgi:hypothetical protein